MDPYLAQLREIERAAYRAYERKLFAFFEARDALKHKGWLEEEGYEEVRELDLEQWAEWEKYKQVQKECRREELIWQNRPQVQKEPL